MGFDIEAEIAGGQDFDLGFGRQFGFVITNPPFSARQFIDRSLGLADCVVMLLPYHSGVKQAVIGGGPGTGRLRVEQASGFTGDNRTDATDYAWLFGIAGAAGYRDLGCEEGKMSHIWEGFKEIETGKQAH